MPSGSLRYKMTVEVETPEGLKTGSAVREVTMGMMPNILGPGNTAFTGSADVKGEAVVVDLGKRGKVFALLRNVYGPDYAYQIVFNVFSWPGGPGGALSADGIRYYTSLKKSEKTILGPDNYPEIVTFLDPVDPKTVEVVLETEAYDVEGRMGLESHQRIKADNFETIFGEGVKLKNINIQITQEPVTRQIRKLIPSYGPETQYLEWFKKLPYADAKKIGPYDFITGDKS